ncbi:MAG: hypothetical protein CVU81_00315 [Euryarchaeota archaeon HGW-Euryarchaeota-1]|nr:MAG: hypothetical protein CVU81_00315 [Euryarchaeota archaeon HGW-Euryarchaeota-1]
MEEGTGMLGLGITSEGVTALFIPILIAAVVLVAGVIIAKIIRSVLKSFLKRAGIEKKIADSPAGSALGNYSIVSFFVNIVYIYMILIVLQQAVKFLNLDIVSYYVGVIAGFFPAFVYGVILIIVGFVIGEYVSYYIKRAAILFAGLFAVASKFLIVFFFLVMALPHFMVDPTIVIDTFRILLIAFAVAFALGLGLAIGLGAKDTVADILKVKRSAILKIIDSVEESVKKRK